MIAKQFMGVGVVGIVFGGSIFALTYGEGYPEANRLGIALAGMGICFLTIAFCLGMIGDYMKHHNAASEE